MKVYGMKLVMAGIFVLFLAVIVSAQSFILQDPPVDKTRFSFQYLRPDFKGDDSLSFFSGAYDLTVSIPVGSQLNIVGALPFATLGVEDETESGIGNIYLGLRHRLKSTAEKGLSLSLGVFLPTMPEDKWSVFLMGVYSNYYEFQKYMPNVLTVYGNVAYHHIKSEGLMLGMEIGPKLAIPTKDSEGDTELFLHYGLSAGFRTGGVAFKAELAGIGIITEEADNFGDRFVHMLAFGVQWVRGSIRPGIFYKIYLKEELRDIVSGVIGIKLDVILQQ